MEGYQTLKDLKGEHFSSQVIINRLNHQSLVNSRKWSSSSMAATLSPAERLPVGWHDMQWKGSDETKLRLYELRDAIENLGLNSNFWFVVDSLKENTWKVDNPFIVRQFLVKFVPKHGDIEHYYYSLTTEQSKPRFIKTNSLLEAILLNQP